MTGMLLPVPALRAVDANGVPLNGALLQFYLSGTTTPTPVYTDKTLGTPLSNPVVSNSAGLFPPIYIDPTITYRAQLLTAAMSLVQDIDPVAQPPIIGAGSITSSMLAAGVALANLGYTPVNKAGDTATNLLLAASALAVNSAGFLGCPVNEQDGAYTFALSDAGKMVRGASVSAFTWTIPPNSAVAFPQGTIILLRNPGPATITVARGVGVIQLLAGGSTNKDVAFAAEGLATLVQEYPNQWVINGAGIS
jgi:hypothetical protein